MSAYDGFEPVEDEETPWHRVMPDESGMMDMVHSIEKAFGHGLVEASDVQEFARGGDVPESLVDGLRGAAAFWAIRGSF